MDINKVIKYLDQEEKEWFLTLSEQDLSYMIKSVHKIPSIMLFLRDNPEEYSDQNNDQNNDQLEEKKEKQDIAVVSGQKGESLFEYLCGKLSSDYKVVNMAKTGHAGDFIISYTRDGFTSSCLVDVKNYKNKVPTKEIDKFKSDLQYNNCNSGLLLSLKSKITGIRDNICMTKEPLSCGDVPVMYLSDVPHDLIIECIKILCMKGHTYGGCKLSNIPETLSFINGALSMSSSTRRILAELHITMTGQITKCQEQLIGLEVQIKNAISSVSKTVRNIEEEETSIDVGGFCHKDHNGIQQLAELDWDSISTSKSGKLIFKLKALVLTCEGLKTRTNVVIDMEPNDFPEIVDICKEKKGKYHRRLDQTLINTITLLFEQ